MLRVLVFNALLFILHAFNVLFFILIMSGISINFSIRKVHTHIGATHFKAESQVELSTIDLEMISPTYHILST